MEINRLINSPKDFAHQQPDWIVNSAHRALVQICTLAHWRYVKQLLYLYLRQVCQTYSPQTASSQWTYSIQPTDLPPWLGGVACLRIWGSQTPVDMAVSGRRTSKDWHCPSHHPGTSLIDAAKDLPPWTPAATVPSAEAGAGAGVGVGAWGDDSSSSSSSTTHAAGARATATWLRARVVTTATSSGLEPLLHHHSFLMLWDGSSPGHKVSLIPLSWAMKDSGQ